MLRGDQQRSVNSQEVVPVRVQAARRLSRVRNAALNRQSTLYGHLGEHSLSKDIGDHGKTDRPKGSAVHTEVGYDERVFTLGRPTCPRPILGQGTLAAAPSIPCHEAQDRGFNVFAMTFPIRESPRQWRLRVPPITRGAGVAVLRSLRAGGSTQPNTTNPRALPGQRRPAWHLPSRPRPSFHVQGFERAHRAL